MIHINGKLFLSELSKMLAFMHDEDRLAALSMYEEMFCKAQDQEALLACLKSPTKQAVLLARSYDAKARRKELSGEAAGGGIPAFLALISDISEDALESAGYTPAAPQPVLEEPVFRSVSPVPEETEVIEEEPDPEPEVPAFSGLELDFEKEIRSFTTVSSEEVPADPPGEPDLQEEKADYETAVIDADSVPSAEDLIDGFFVSGPKEPAGSPLSEAEASLQKTEDITRSAPVFVPQIDEPARKSAPAKSASAKGKTNGFLAVLYSLAAIPVTALILLLLLVFALASLGTSAVALISGGKALLSCFGSFAVFADIMAVMGASFILIALGVLFLWIFLWLIVKAIPGVVKGAFRLGKKLCTKGGSNQ